MKPSSVSPNQHSIASLGDKLRNRYDEAFIRGELTNLRQQVTVLHDAVMAFITKVDRSLAAQEAAQKHMSARLTRLEKATNLGPLIAITPKKVTGSKSKIQDDGSNAEAGVSTARTYSVIDAQGDLANFVAFESDNGAGADEEVTVSVVLPSTLHEEPEEEQDGGDDAEMNSDEGGDDSDEIQAKAESPTRTLSRSVTHARPQVIAKPQAVNWDQLAAECRKNILLPERKGKGGKVSGRLGPGSPAWTQYLRTAMHRTLGDLAMFRYAREGSRIFKSEREAEFNEIKDHVVEFCKDNGIVPPEDKLMDEIAWAFLRNKKRYRAKV